ncbi:MAG: hypothetical protein KAS32_14210 [Candidatus Peribacteraceae bacterium]|nr:hypothetical protein [Candidatus Peribacteraceae bacterium]
MKIIEVSFDELMEFRRIKNKELYANYESGKDEVDVSVQADGNIVLTASIAKKSSSWQNVKLYANKAIKMYDKRLISHNWGDSSTWTAVDDSLWQVIPDAGTKLILTHIQFRFPKSTKILAANAFVYKVYLSTDGVTPVDDETEPAISLVYESTLSLMEKANTSIQITTDTIPDAFDDKMVEVMFKYANPSTLEGAPIVLRSSLNERIDAYLLEHDIIKDSGGASMNSSTWAIANCKQMIDF